MSWHIHLVENTIELSEDCANDIISQFGDDRIEENENNAATLLFSEDDMEHMDYMDEIESILTKHKVSGTVAFTSNEGDNKGQSWGYKYQNGVLTHITGMMFFENDNQEPTLELFDPELWNGTHVALTGKWVFTRNDLANCLESAGAIVEKSITSKTKSLICASEDSGSAKIVKARAKGIEILNYEDVFV